jgi:CyaY protein
MLDSEFAVLAGRALADIEARLDASGADLDYSTVSDGMLEIEFADGGKIVVNRHAAAREIWMAGRARAFHFRWQRDDWRDTRDGRGLMTVLSELVSAQLEQVNKLKRIMYDTRHCEERSDVAIHEAVWIATSRSPSNDGINIGSSIN